MKRKGHVAIVTGASEGIGLATAHVLAHEDYRVVLSARNREALERARRKIAGAVAIPADMRIEEEARQLVAQTMQEFGRIDVLINNAGQAQYGPMATASIAEFREILELNVIGCLRMMQLVVPPMRAAGKGVIINVSSGTSRMVLPGAGTYASTKAALNMLSAVARQEFEPDGIIVSTIYPYITATGFGENAFGASYRPSGKRPSTMPPPHSAEFVASKISELIESGEAEMVLSGV